MTQVRDQVSTLSQIFPFFHSYKHIFVDPKSKEVNKVKSPAKAASNTPRARANSHKDASQTTKVSHPRFQVSHQDCHQSSIVLNVKLLGPIRPRSEDQDARQLSSCLQISGHLLSRSGSGRPEHGGLRLRDLRLQYLPPQPDGHAQKVSPERKRPCSRSCFSCYCQ